MKIATMTWFHYENYGTALQAYALFRKMTDMGHTVNVIQYYPRASQQLLPEEAILKEYSRKVLPKIRNKLNGNIVARQNERYFRDFLDQQLALTEECRTLPELEGLNHEFDCFVCGSDQIWAPTCFDSHYFLDFVKCPEKKVAYAPSVGLPRIENTYIKRQIAELTGSFGSLSTREESGSRIIQELTGRNVKTVLDPTLLLTGDEWTENLSLKDTQEPYLLAYFLGTNRNHWKKVYEIAAKLNLNVRIVPVFKQDWQKDGVIRDPLGPTEFVEQIKNAAFVCTDSFHGLAFSINFKVPFCCFERFKVRDKENQNSRIYNILHLLDLENRLSGRCSLTEQIDWVDVHSRLMQLRSESVLYLTEALEKAKQVKQPERKKHIYEINTLCCGCGACAAKCPRNAIHMERNKMGFWTAVVDEAQCISCGLCQKVCPMQNGVPAQKISSGSCYAYKDPEMDVLMKSSSGGFAHRMAMQLLEAGYSIVGCAFNVEKQIAEHIVIHPGEQEKLPLLQGSKYMQSRFFDALEQAKNCSNPIAFFGTPCQIAGARSLLADREDVVYIDLICHGVPSYRLYEKYRKLLNKKFGIIPDQMRIIFRHKPSGWRDRFIYSTDSLVKVKRHQSVDEYFLMFEYGNCYSDACYECRWRAGCSADIRIGDYWGERYKNDKTGVSIVLAMTDKGTRLLSKLPAESVTAQNMADYTNVQQMENVPKTIYYHEIMQKLCDEETALEEIVRDYVQPFEQRKQVRKKLNEIIQTVKKIIK